MGSISYLKPWNSLLFVDLITICTFYHCFLDLVKFQLLNHISNVELFHLKLLFFEQRCLTCARVWQCCQMLAIIVICFVLLHSANFIFFWHLLPYFDHYMVWGIHATRYQAIFQRQEFWCFLTILGLLRPLLVEILNYTAKQPRSFLWQSEKHKIFNYTTVQGQLLIATQGRTMCLIADY